MGDPGAVNTCGVVGPEIGKDSAEAETDLLPVVDSRGAFPVTSDTDGRIAVSGPGNGATAAEADLARTSLGLSPERLI